MMTHVLARTSGHSPAREAVRTRVSAAAAPRLTQRRVIDFGTATSARCRCN
ncbi:hypothetical protein [Actinacidiphila sp. ITFR-21]|uniref:hypothetical protein n=1 Tax=Actinacidiphila sp. ITFR-21 TaxID=3075199 RepID=UPI00288A2A43|nr:hypothetical protein [Streptomyces sp. ITFR-21]WNI14836.1 hypothetical protein RLT57_04320 [Streptomyces sp. ITFR-21]